MYKELEFKNKGLDILSSQISYIRNLVPLLEEPAYFDTLLDYINQAESNISKGNLTDAIIDILPAMKFTYTIFKSWVTRIESNKYNKVPTGFIIAKYPYKKDASILKDLLEALHTINKVLTNLEYWYIFK